MTGAGAPLSPRLSRVQVPRLPDRRALAPYLDRIDASGWYSNRGPLTLELERRLSEAFGSGPSSVVSFGSGTLALEAAILAFAGVADAERPLALVPAYTFVATAQAAIRCGYSVRLVDVDPGTWMMDPDAMRSHPEIGRAGLVLPVAALGRAPDLDGWERFARETGVPAVIDAAASFERFLGPGALRPSARVPVALSFHATKSFSTGEGGAVLVDDAERWIELATISNFGLDEERMCRAYGLNGKMSEYHAALGLACLDDWPARAARHAHIADAFREVAAGWPGRLLAVPQVSSAYVAFEAEDEAAAGTLVDGLAREGIATRRWYGRGLQEQPAFAGAEADPLPHAADLAARHIGLPASIDLTDEEIGRIGRAAGRAFAEL